MMRNFFQMKKEKTFCKPAAVHLLCTCATFLYAILDIKRYKASLRSATIPVCSHYLLNETWTSTWFKNSTSIHRASERPQCHSGCMSQVQSWNFLCIDSAMCSTFPFDGSLRNLQSARAAAIAKHEAAACRASFLKSGTSVLFTDGRDAAGKHFRCAEFVPSSQSTIIAWSFIIMKSFYKLLYSSVILFSQISFLAGFWEWRFTVAFIARTRILQLNWKRNIRTSWEPSNDGTMLIRYSENHGITLW